MLRVRRAVLCFVVGAALLAAIADAARGVLAPVAPPVVKPPPSVAKKYALTDKLVIATFNVAQINRTTPLSFTYDLEGKVGKAKGHGVETKPGNRLVFDVPKFQQGLRISQVWLKHRKPAEKKALLASIVKVKSSHPLKPDYTWDKQPVFHSFKCRDPKTKTWFTWDGPRYHTEEGEPREYIDPVYDQRRFAPARKVGDALYDHLDGLGRWLIDENHKVAPRGCDLIMITNDSPKFMKLAQGEVHELRLEFHPRKLEKKLKQEAILTPNSIFPREPFSPLAHFGGGREVTPGVISYMKTLYPKAGMLIPKSTEIRNVGNWLSFKAGGAVVRLRSGRPWAYCDFMLGNAKYDPKKPLKGQVSRDGWVGTTGKSKIFATLREVGNPNMTGLLKVDWPVNRAMILRVSPNNTYVVPTSMTAKQNTSDPKLATTRPVTPPVGTAFIRLDVVGDPVAVMAVRCQYAASPLKHVPEFFLPKPPPTKLPPASNKNATLPSKNQTASANKTVPVVAPKPAPVKNTTAPTAKARFLIPLPQAKLPKMTRLERIALGKHRWEVRTIPDAKPKAKPTMAHKDWNIHET